MKRSFCIKNIKKFKRHLNNQSWDFVYEGEDAQASFSRFQGVIDVHFITNFKIHILILTLNYTLLQGIILTLIHG